jgi:hypothetical protein
MVIVSLLGILLCVGWEMGDVKAQGELGDVLIFELF